MYEVNKKQPTRPSFPRVFITGPETASRFGTAVSILGDLNKDGYEDVAIGAPSPWSPDSGKVYIYMGSSSGLGWGVQPVQVLTALKTPGVPLYGFGSSISGKGDIDKNDYPDVVIGAYQSDSIVIMRLNSSHCPRSPPTQYTRLMMSLQDIADHQHGGHTDPPRLGGQGRCLS